jgi:hypothetical protein
MPLITPTSPFFSTTALADNSGTKLKVAAKTVSAAKKGFSKIFEFRAENIKKATSGKISLGRTLFRSAEPPTTESEKKPKHARLVFSSVKSNVSSRQSTADRWFDC